MASEVFAAGFDAQFAGKMAAPHILGYFFNWGLYGILIVQTYLYYISFPNDKLGIKCLVYFVFLIETIQTALLSHDGFVTYGLYFGTPEAFATLRTAWFSVPILSSIAGCTIQIFFAHRIKVLSGSSLASATVLLLSLLQGGTGIAQGVRSYFVNVSSRLNQETRVTVLIWLISGAVCDVVIASFMTFFLSRKKTGYHSTDAVITRVVRLVIETGTLTAVLAIVVVILLFMPGPPWYFPVVEVIGKIYSNNLLVIFNRRIHIVGGRNQMVIDTSRAARTREILSSMAVNVQTPTRSDVDGIVVHQHREVWSDSMRMKVLDTSDVEVGEVNRNAHAY